MIDRLTQHMLQNLDFDQGFGIDTGMINNHSRNQFFNQCLSQCQDKVVLDIGSGTGILSVLAAMHGARRVYAFEIDKKNYELSRYLIERSGLQHKITVFHCNIMCVDQQVLKLDPIDIVVSETFANDAFLQNFAHLATHINSNFNLAPDCVFVPEEIQLEISLVDRSAKNEFDPGVAMPDEFAQNLNLCLSAYRNNYTPAAQMGYNTGINVDFNLPYTILTEFDNESQKIFVARFLVNKQLCQQVDQHKSIVGFDFSGYQTPYLKLHWSLHTSAGYTFNLDRLGTKPIGVKVDKEKSDKFYIRFEKIKHSTLISQI